MKELISSIQVNDLINVLLLLTAVVGIFLTYWQTRLNARTNKAAFFKDLYSTMFRDPIIRKAFYQIEYDKFIYDDSFHGSENEQLIDRLLSFSDLVCDLYFQKIISKHEMDFFKYEFIRVYQDEEIQKYLTFLKNFYLENQFGTVPFPSYIKYCVTKLED
jgi:hypothetical protein